MTVVNDEIGRD